VSSDSDVEEMEMEARVYSRPHRASGAGAEAPAAPAVPVPATGAPQAAAATGTPTPTTPAAIAGVVQGSPGRGLWEEEPWSRRGKGRRSSVGPPDSPQSPLPLGSPQRRFPAKAWPPTTAAWTPAGTQPGGAVPVCPRRTHSRVRCGAWGLWVGGRRLSFGRRWNSRRRRRLSTSF